ncbi:hypothetical protein CXF85_19855 [Colwellia sp. 75C3]|uniref:hypothetical protein n=1 Tax=Colwellia sp. 75C3 TaxID=888425 RepID=UPI000CA864F6|nr:hypothetical protein [Colwellia sp. 75C3]PKG81020.1 hypothetical protein CXF85_19855 [Colwellia sp. 75C3]
MTAIITDPRELLQLEQAERRKKITAINAEYASKETQLIQEITEKLLEEDPERIFYKLMQQNCIEIFDLLLCGVDANTALNIVAIVATTGKDNHVAADWLEKVKHSGRKLQENHNFAYSRMHIFGGPIAIAKIEAMKRDNIYSVADVAEATTLNKAVNIVAKQVTAHDRILNLEDRVKRLEIQSTVSTVRQDITDDRLTALENKDISTWQEKAIALKRDGKNNTQIAKAVDRSRGVVSGFMNSPSAKKALATK